MPAAVSNFLPWEEVESSAPFQKASKEEQAYVKQRWYVDYGKAEEIKKRLATPPPEVVVDQVVAPPLFQPERGIFGDVGSRLARGAVGTAELAGHALNTIGAETVGQKLVNASEGMLKDVDFLKPDESEVKGEGFVKKGIMEGIESAVPSLAGGLGGAATGAGVGTMVGGPAGTLVGGLVGGLAGALGLFGAGVYGKEKDAALKKGLTEEEAHRHGLEQGLVEGGIEAIATPIELLTGGFGKVATQPLKTTVKELLKTPIKTMVKNYGKTMGVEVGTEMLQSGLGNELAKGHAMSDEATTEAVLGSIIPAITMSMMFGMGTQALTSVHKYNVKNALTDASVPAEKRTAAIDEVYSQILPEDVELADAWKQMSTDKVQRGEAIDIDEDYTKFAVDKKKLEKSGDESGAEDAIKAAAGVTTTVPGVDSVVEDTRGDTGGIEAVPADIEPEQPKGVLARVAEKSVGQTGFVPAVMGGVEQVDAAMGQNIEVNSPVKEVPVTTHSPLEEIEAEHGQGISRQIGAARKEGREISIDRAVALEKERIQNADNIEAQLLAERRSLRLSPREAATLLYMRESGEGITPNDEKQREVFTSLVKKGAAIFNEAGGSFAAVPLGQALGAVKKTGGRVDEQVEGESVNGVARQVDSENGEVRGKADAVPAGGKNAGQTTTPPVHQSAAALGNTGLVGDADLEKVIGKDLKITTIGKKYGQKVAKEARAALVAGENITLREAIARTGLINPIKREKEQRNENTKAITQGVEGQGNTAVSTSGAAGELGIQPSIDGKTRIPGNTDGELGVINERASNSGKNDRDIGIESGGLDSGDTGRKHRGGDGRHISPVSQIVDGSQLSKKQQEAGGLGETDANHIGDPKLSGEPQLPREIVEYTTKKGKVIKGVVRKDLTIQQAKDIDPYTFKYDGGFFIREKYLKGERLNDKANAGDVTKQENTRDESGGERTPETGLNKSPQNKEDDGETRGNREMGLSAFNDGAPGVSIIKNKTDIEEQKLTSEGFKKTHATQGIGENLSSNKAAEFKKTPSNTSRETQRQQLAEKLSEILDAGPITSKSLFAAADEAFGGTQAGGVYSPKDAYDAMEAAVSIYLRTTDYFKGRNTSTVAEASKAAETLTAFIKDNLPTQTKRDAEMDEYQQFSTPPALAFVANWVANVDKSDTLLEPSAGTGDLALWAQGAGAKIILNELSKRRVEILNGLFPEARIFAENAEQLNNVLPEDVRPTVVIMNPPFSSTAGRIPGQRKSSNGTNQVAQALSRLEPGGRLVAITGGQEGWYSEIAKKYTVRADIEVSGKDYAKYGTTYDNRLTIIDKAGPTTDTIIKGSVQSASEIPALLEGVRNERQKVEPSADKQTSGKVIEKNRLESTLGNATVDSGIDAMGSGTRGIGIAADKRRGDGYSRQTGNKESSEADGPVDENGYRGRDGNEPAGRSGGSGSATVERPADSGLKVESTEAQKNTDKLSDSIFSGYQPQRLNIPGAKQHPTPLVQSSAMAAVDPPAPSYTPNLPEEVITQGLLSNAQLEAVVYAGQAHQEKLPGGERRGFFIGDGTGVGKGREIAGIILDNIRQGREKAVWVSFNEGLINDAKRDFSGVGGDPNTLFWQGKTKAGNELTEKKGILFTTYPTLRGGEKKQATDLGRVAGKTRLEQIVNWLGKDFDGVIVFDEAHSMGNVVEMKGKRGTKKPSGQAIAGVNLQKELPNARIVYVSATGATEISNLGYATRLGLWGENTPFPDVKSFIQRATSGGVAAMELISRDMKALGMYISRALSFEGVTYQRLEHQLTPLQNDIYNELATAWQGVLQNVNAALEQTGGAKNGNAKSSAMSAFWGSHQRFFNQIITSLQTPTVIDDMRQQIKGGNAIVVQLVNTNEATQEREIAKAAAAGAELEELDFTPRQMLMEYVKNSFPVQAFEETVDEHGNTVSTPVVDSNGMPVFNRDAIAMRDNLLGTLEHIRVPENPIDAIINAFGSEAVGEVTGRARRFIQGKDENGEFKIVEEKRGKNAAQSDAKAFQNGEKPILIFSQAGGTGFSFHADNSAKNQKKRIHYILQPGWRADGAVQGFGRTHRTNQAQPPHYVLPTTNLKAQKRFVSSIARRLDQLGALTRGQRQATGQGMFSASDNLESQYAADALHVLFTDMYNGRSSLSFNDITSAMGLTGAVDKKTGALNQTALPTIPQFLNRLLSLTSGQQDEVFAEFEKRLDEVVNYAIQRGTYDSGMETVKAENIVKTHEDTVHTDSRSGAETKYIELDVTKKIQYQSFSQMQDEMRHRKDQLAGYYTDRKGNVFTLYDLGTRLNASGVETERGLTVGIRKGHHRYIDNVSDIKRGHRETYDKNERKVVKEALSTPIGKEEAKRLWGEQIETGPKTETKKDRMITGVILPIWDRIAGDEKVWRLQTDEGEQIIGRWMNGNAAKETLKNLGKGSEVARLDIRTIWKRIQSGDEAVLANGWGIKGSRVSGEKRVELTVKRGGTFTPAEIKELTKQGVFFERIQWQDRAFIPVDAISVFSKVTASRPVVDLGEKEKYSFADGKQKEPASIAELPGEQSRVVSRLQRNGKLKVLSARDALVLLGRDAESKGKFLQGFYRKDGVAHIIPENIQSGKLWGVVRHEVGVHAAELMQTHSGFQRLLLTIEERMNEKSADGEAIRKADAMVPKNTKAEHWAEERLAYLIESAPKVGIVRRFFAILKNILAKMGLDPAWFTIADLSALAEVALRLEARGSVKKSFTVGVDEFAMDAKMSIQAAARKIQGLEAFKKWFGDFEMAANLDAARTFVDQVVAGQRPESIMVGTVSGKVAGKIKKHTGVDTKGRSLELIADDIAHAIKGHGNVAAEKARGQVAITADDLKILPIVLQEPTDITHGSIQGGRQSVRFEKKINGTIVAVEIVPFQGGAIQFKTAWKRPSETVDATSPNHTSKTDLSPSHSYNQRIQQLLEKSKASQVVDADGYPLVVYHGTAEDQISKFNIGETGGIFFTSSKSTAQTYGKENYPSYLSIKNPLIIDARGKSYKEIIPAAFIQEAKSAGNDGVIVKNIKDDAAGYKHEGDTYIVFSPSQIKSIYNQGTWDGSNPDIMKSVAQSMPSANGLMSTIRAASQAPDSEEFKRWFGKSKITSKGKPHILYHGTSDPRFLQDQTYDWVFDVNKTAHQGSSPLAGLGIFLGNDVIASAHSGGNEDSVHPFYVRVENPLVISSAELEKKVVDVASAKAFRKRAMELNGHDGIIIKDRGQVIAFEPNQLKSARQNTGEYSRENDDVRYSMADVELTGNGRAEKDFKMAVHEAKDVVAAHEKKDSSFLHRVFSTPEYYFGKYSAAAGRVIEHALKKNDKKFEYQAQLFHDNGKDVDFVKVGAEFAKEKPAEYKQAVDYLVEVGRTYNGFSVENDGNTWKVSNPAGDFISEEESDSPITYETEKDAITAMIGFEKDHALDLGLSKAAAEYVALFRRVTNRAFDTMAAEMRRIDAERVKAGLPELSAVGPKPEDNLRWGLFEKGKKVPVVRYASEEEALESLENASKLVSFMVYAGKNKGKKMTFKKAFANQLAAQRYARRIYGTVVEKKKFGNLTMRRLEDKELRPKTLQEMIAEIGDLRGVYFPRIRQSGAYVLKAFKKDHDPFRQSFDLPFLDLEKGSGKTAILMKRLINRGTPIGRKIAELKADGYEVSVKKDESISEDVFEATKLSASLEGILSQTFVGQEKGTEAELKASQIVNQLLTLQVSDIIKARGFLSSRMSRAEQHWQGYETDGNVALASYVQGVAGGMAKRETAKNMILAMSGKDYSWQDYKLEVENPIYEDWETIVNERRVDPGKQKNLWKDTRDLVVDVLRNDEQIDRIVGTLRGIAVIKFLGFRISSAAINLTNMVLGVPATISSFSKLGLPGTMRMIGISSMRYAEMLGKKKIGKEDSEIFNYIKTKGWDAAQFNMEAAEMLRSKLGRKYDKFADVAMMMFGAVERANRAITIHAAFRALKSQSEWKAAGSMPLPAFEQMMQNAQHISNRAHGIYNKATAPKWTQGDGVVLKLFYTFQKFSHSYMLNAIEMGFDRKDYGNAAYLLLSPALLAGAGASLPVSLLMQAAQALGVGGDDPEERFYDWVAGIFGSDAIARQGITGVMGINTKGSLEMNFAVPTSLKDLAGAPGAVFVDAAKAGGYLKEGELLRALEVLLPSGIGSPIKALREYSEGITTGSASHVFFGDEPLKGSGLDAVIRALSFNPARLSGIREKIWNEKEVAGKYADMRAEIYKAYRKAYILNPDKRTAADEADLVAAIMDFNRKLAASGRHDLHPITGESIRIMLRRAVRPNLRERLRVVGEE